VGISPAQPPFFSRVEFSSEEHPNAPDSEGYRLEAGKLGRLAHRKNFNQDFSAPEGYGKCHNEANQFFYRANSIFLFMLAFWLKHSTDGLPIAFLAAFFMSPFYPSLSTTN